MLRYRSLFGFAVLFSTAVILNTLPADQPGTSDSKTKARKNSEAGPAEEKIVTLSPKEAPTEETIRKALETPVEVKFEDVPFHQFVASLAKATGTNIWIDEQALTEEGVAIDEPVTRHGKPLAVGRLLDRVLEPLGLTWIIQDDVVQITTIIAAEEKFITRVYPIGDLLKYAKEQEVTQGNLAATNRLHPVQFGEGEEGFGNFSPTGPTDWLVSSLQYLTSGPWVDLDGTGGTISSDNKTLVIRQTHKVQHQCKRIIDAIREFTRGELNSNPTAIRPSHYGTEEDKTVEKALSKVVNIKAKDQPLNRVLASLADAVAVPVSIYEQALNEEGVAIDEPINLEFQNLPARSVLHRVLDPLGLQAIVEDGQLFVSTIVETDERLTTKVHDIRNLDEAGYNGNAILDLLQQETSGPWVDLDGTGGTIETALPGLLIVRQTYKIHREMEAILANLRKTIPKPSGDSPKKELADPKAVSTQFYHLDKGTVSAIKEAIQSLVEPDTWHTEIQNATGRMVLIENALVVKHTNETHTKIKQFLRNYYKFLEANQFVAPRESFGGGFGGESAKRQTGGGLGSGRVGGGGAGAFQVPPRRTKWHQQKTN